MATLNVRLSESDSKVVKALRKQGVAISDLMRQALHKEYQKRNKRPLKAAEVRAMIDQIEADHPVPKGLTPRPFSTLDRKAVRQYIADKLQNKRMT